ncbi:MAG: ubiquitin-like domain-containing protein [Acidimicrobiales bacterium]
MITTTPPSTTGTSLRPEPDEAHPAPPASPAAGRPVSSRFPDRIWWVAAAALLALGAVAAAVYYVTSPVGVELSVDGQTRSIETRADSVADLLVDHDITVGDADLVDPPLETGLAEGDSVVVRFARPLTVVIDGSETVHTTTELTVGDALDDAGAPIEGAAVSVPLAETLPLAGVTVEVTTPKSITLDVGGQPLVVTSTARTVGEVLEAEAIALAGTDTLAPSADTAVTEAMTITVTRIRVETETRTETIAHDTVERDDPDLTVGTREVVTGGVDGTQDVIYSVTYTNDEPTSEEAVSSAVTSEPVTEIVAVGTKPAPVAAQTSDPGVAASGGSSGLNWAALAQCESSGNAKAVNPAGYYGLYQFAPATWASVGGTGNPVDASPAEQTNRAQILYDRSGAGQWPHCGRHLFE